MSKQGSTFIAGIVIVVLIVALIGALGFFQISVAPSIFTSSTTTTTTSASCTPSTCVNITIYQGAASPSGAPGYSPDVVTVVIGVNNTVVWYNNDTAIHSVTATDGSFNDQTMRQGDTFIYTFTKPGTYNYYCIYHSWMKGTVIVKQKS